MNKPEVVFVARVLFTESGLESTLLERHLIALALHNRVGSLAFDNPANLYAVVRHIEKYVKPEIIKDPLWALSEQCYKHICDVPANASALWRDCAALALGRQPLKGLPRIMTYHSREFEDKVEWTLPGNPPKPVLCTEHFCFYTYC